MDARSYMRYQHTLKMAYRRQGISDDVISQSFPSYFNISGSSPRVLIAKLAAGSKMRLNMLKRPQGHLISENTSVRTLSFGTHEIMIPLINRQGVERYGTLPAADFNFMAETQLGLLDDAKVIYDFGSHHGVWSMYYALISGTGGRVVCFEPAIMNIEISALLFLINGAHTIVNVGAAVGAGPGRDGQHPYAAGFAESAPSNKTADFDSYERPVIDLQDAAWENADFLRMNVEGLEHDIITRNPWIFGLATHMHIDVHIPNLLQRGLDYREIIDLIPFDQFSIQNYQDGQLAPIDKSTALSGICSLMMKRREIGRTS